MDQLLTRVRRSGVGVLLVEQNARQSLTIADRGYLIETGRVVGRGEAGDLVADPAVHEAYLGVGGVHVRRRIECAKMGARDATSNLPS